MDIHMRERMHILGGEVISRNSIVLAILPSVLVRVPCYST